MGINIVKYGSTTLIDLTPTTATASDVASGKVFFNNAGVQTTGTATSGSGFTLLNTTSLGTMSTSSTSATDTGKSLTVSNATGYDALLVDVSVNSVTNNRHTSTCCFVFLTGTSNVSTKNTVAVGSNKWNSKVNSSGTASTRQSTTAYGIYPYSASISGSSVTITLYYRYNSNNTGTINNSYTARVYGVKLYDLIGG